jgi:4'-phosphopantetheinyl transferase
MYLRVSPQDLRFVFGPQGKPALLDGRLEFNVSHSGPLVLLAFASGSPVGVDVEQEKKDRDRIAIAQRYFAPAETEKVRRAEDVAGAFYRTWTAKESVIKAVGGGLSIDLSSFLVTPDRGTFTAVENAGDDARLTGWYVQTLPEPGEGAHAAVAVRGEGWTTVVRHV